MVPKLPQALFTLFRSRPDAYGFQPNGGGPIAKRETFTPQLLQGHIEGHYRIGAYPLLPNSTACWSCLDFDDGSIVGPSLIRDALTKRGLPCVIERSRSKGFHVWFFFHHPTPARQLRERMRGVLRSVGLRDDIEIFPKQDMSRDKDFLGNFVWLPCYGGPSVDGTPRSCFLDLSREGWPPVSDPLEFVEELIRVRDA